MDAKASECFPQQYIPKLISIHQILFRGTRLLIIKENFGI